MRQRWEIPACWGTLELRASCERWGWLVCWTWIAWVTDLTCGWLKWLIWLYGAFSGCTELEWGETWTWLTLESDRDRDGDTWQMELESYWDGTNWPLRCTQIGLEEGWGVGCGRGLGLRELWTWTSYVSVRVGCRIGLLFKNELRYKIIILQKTSL